MANGSIQDFYIKAGVDFDEKSVDKFIKGLEKISETADGVSGSFKLVQVEAKQMESASVKSFSNIITYGKRAVLGITGIATASTFVGQKISQNLIDMDNLASQTGTSIQELEILRRQVEQVGGSASEADSFIANFADKIAQLQLLGGDAGVFLPRIFGEGQSLDNPVKALDSIRNYLLTATKNERLLASKELGISPKLLDLLTKNDETYQAILENSKKTANIDSSYIKQARKFNQDVASLSTEFRKLQVDLFSGVAESLKLSLRELREFIADEDIKTLIIAMVNQISNLFKIMINGLGDILERISYASGQVIKGENISAVKTLVQGTPEQIQKREDYQKYNQTLIGMARLQKDLNSPKSKAIFDALETRGVKPEEVGGLIAESGPINYVRGLQGLPSLSKTVEAVRSRQQTNNINITNNIDGSRNPEAVALEIEKTFKNLEANSLREDIN